VKMHHTALTLGLLALGCLPLGCTGSDNPPGCGIDALMPADGAVLDYAVDGTPQKALDEQALFDLIDGGGVKYTQNGFVCMVVADFASLSESAVVTLWIYDQGTIAGAQGAWDATSSPTYTDLTPTVGDASREDLTLPFNYAADARVDRFLVQLTTDPKTARDSTVSLMQAAVSLARSP
jgi:hypothetical protein